MKEINGCFCFSLRTGGLIIGWLNVVLCLLAIPRFIGLLTELTDFNLAIAFLWSVVCLINLLTGVELLAGIYYEEQKLLKTWIIWNAIVLVLAVIQYINVIEVTIVSLTVLALALALSFYIWLAIYSLHEKMIYSEHDQPTELASVSTI